jgi:hypothetical protein
VIQANWTRHGEKHPMNEHNKNKDKKNKDKNNKEEKWL